MHVSHLYTLPRLWFGYKHITWSPCHLVTSRSCKSSCLKNWSVGLCFLLEVSDTARDCCEDDLQELQESFRCLLIFRNKCLSKPSPLIWADHVWCMFGAAVKLQCVNSDAQPKIRIVSCFVQSFMLSGNGASRRALPVTHMMVLFIKSQISFPTVCPVQRLHGPHWQPCAEHGAAGERRAGRDPRPADLLHEEQRH